MPAYFRATIADLINTPDDQILGALSRGVAAEFYSTINLQHEIWQSEVRFLKDALSKLLQGYATSLNWTILLEYPIPRRGKRLDAVILFGSTIIVLELKSGKAGKDAQLQLEDYCLDLQDFHAESAGRYIIPLLISDHIETNPFSKFFDDQKLQPVYTVNRNNLATTLINIAHHFEKSNVVSIDPIKWDQGEYKPTPTIIEAAKTLYAEHNVKEICRCHAGVENLTTTTEAVLKIIQQAQTNEEKVICFITGVPGSGKTLAGLNIVHDHKLHAGELGSFLSGNGPLVKVLIEALTRDKVARNSKKLTKLAAKREVSTFIQDLHRFRDQYFIKSKNSPVDHIIIFDEAQRAWNSEHLARWLKRRHAFESQKYSEPEIILEIMDRHQWAVIVALIGGGQEINRGEAGLSEWGRTISKRFSKWKIYISPVLKSGGHSTGGQTLFQEIPPHINLFENEALHLNVSIRAYRAEKTSDFVHALLNIELQLAKEILQKSLLDYPICLTRSLENAKTWLRQKRRGTRRIGLTASSGARRLKAYGLDVKNALQGSDDVPNWFLNRIDDVRSSNVLEDVATEFAVQGLELDWSAVCWGADFRFNKGEWHYFRFSGNRWQNVNNPEMQQYILNKYRVLLTRAREALIIWVPQGSSDDLTRKPEFYDSTFEYLKGIGFTVI
jgi:hypothetical protein